MNSNYQHQNVGLFSFKAASIRKTYSDYPRLKKLQEWFSSEMDCHCILYFKYSQYSRLTLFNWVLITITCTLVGMDYRPTKLVRQTNICAIVTNFLPQILTTAALKQATKATKATQNQTWMVLQYHNLTTSKQIRNRLRLAYEKVA